MENSINPLLIYSQLQIKMVSNEKGTEQLQDHELSFVLKVNGIWFPCTAEVM